MSGLISKKSIKERQAMFDWLKDAYGHIITTFPNDLSIEMLGNLIKNIQYELTSLEADFNIKKAECLHETLHHLFYHFWWKALWHKDELWSEFSKKDTDSIQCTDEKLKPCIVLLSQIIQLSVLVNSTSQSKHKLVQSVFTLIGTLSSYENVLYTAILLISELKEPYFSSYSKILRKVLCDESIKETQDPVVYVKAVLLLRRLKLLTKSSSKKCHIVQLVSKLKVPVHLFSWLDRLNLSCKEKFRPDIGKHMLSKKSFRKKLYEVLIEKEFNEILQGSLQVCHEEMLEPQASEIVCDSNASVCILKNSTTQKNEVENLLAATEEAKRVELDIHTEFSEKHVSASPMKPNLSFVKFLDTKKTQIKEISLSYILDDTLQVEEQSIIESGVESNQDSDHKLIIDVDCYNMSDSDNRNMKDLNNQKIKDLHNQKCSDEKMIAEVEMDLILTSSGNMCTSVDSLEQVEFDPSQSLFDSEAIGESECVENLIAKENPCGDNNKETKSCFNSKNNAMNEEALCSEKFELKSNMLHSKEIAVTSLTDSDLKIVDTGKKDLNFEYAGTSNIDVSKDNKDSDNCCASQNNIVSHKIDASQSLLSGLASDGASFLNHASNLNENKNWYSEAQFKGANNSIGLKKQLKSKRKTPSHHEAKERSSKKACKLIKMKNGSSSKSVDKSSLANDSKVGGNFQQCNTIKKSHFAKSSSKLHSFSSESDSGISVASKGPKYYLKNGSIANISQSPQVQGLENFNNMIQLEDNQLNRIFVNDSTEQNIPHTLNVRNKPTDTKNVTIFHKSGQSFIKDKDGKFIPYLYENTNDNTVKDSRKVHNNAIGTQDKQFSLREFPIIIQPNNTVSTREHVNNVHNSETNRNVFIVSPNKSCDNTSVVNNTPYKIECEVINNSDQHQNRSTQNAPTIKIVINLNNQKNDKPTLQTPTGFDAIAANAPKPHFGQNSSFFEKHVHFASPDSTSYETESFPLFQRLHTSNMFSSTPLKSSFIKKYPIFGSKPSIESNNLMENCYLELQHVYTPKEGNGSESFEEGTMYYCYDSDSNKIFIESPISELTEKRQKTQVAADRPEFFPHHSSNYDTLSDSHGNKDKDAISSGKNSYPLSSKDSDMKHRTPKEIYTDQETEDDRGSVSTMSNLSFEETDSSMQKISDSDYFPTKKCRKVGLKRRKLVKTPAYHHRKPKADKLNSSKSAASEVTNTLSLPSTQSIAVKGSSTNLCENKSTARSGYNLRSRRSIKIPQNLSVYKL